MDAAHFEKTLSSEVLFEGRVVTLTKDVALLENGETSIREVVHHHGGAYIVHDSKYCFSVNTNLSGMMPIKTYPFFGNKKVCSFSNPALCF